MFVILHCSYSVNLTFFRVKHSLASAFFALLWCLNTHCCVSICINHQFCFPVEPYRIKTTTVVLYVGLELPTLCSWILLPITEPSGMLNSAWSVLAPANCIAELPPYLTKWNRCPPLDSDRRNLSSVNDLVAGYTNHLIGWEWKNLLRYTL